MSSKTSSPPPKPEPAAKAEPIRNPLIPKNPMFPLSSNGVPLLRHNGSDERRAFLDDKIVSNLHEQMSGRGALGITNTRQYGAQHFNPAASYRLRPPPLLSR